MKIYVSHATAFDFINELYNPLKHSLLNNNHKIILPHEKSDEPSNSKDFMKNNCDLMIAEISHRSTGLGIELWRADVYNVPIIFIFKKWTKIAWSVKVIDGNFIEYDDSKDLIEKLEKVI